MKKILCTVMVLVVLVALCGCGNKAFGLGNFTFRKIHVDTPHFSGCIEVQSWYETERGLEVRMKNGEGLFLSEGTYMMIENECPFCH